VQSSPYNYGSIWWFGEQGSGVLDADIHLPDASSWEPEAEPTTSERLADVERWIRDHPEHISDDGPDPTRKER